MAVIILRQEARTSFDKVTTIKTFYQGTDKSTDVKPTDCEYGSEFRDEDGIRSVYSASGWDEVPSDTNTAKALGQLGSVIITDTATYTGEWSVIVAKTDTVFNTLTSNVTKNSLTTLAVAADWGTLYAGEKIYGRFTTIKLTSGSIQAFQ